MCVCFHSNSKTHTDSHQLIPIKAITVNYLKMQLHEVTPHLPPEKPKVEQEGGNKRVFLLKKISLIYDVLSGADWVLCCLWTAPQQSLLSEVLNLHESLEISLKCSHQRAMLLFCSQVFRILV